MHGRKEQKVAGMRTFLWNRQVGRAGVKSRAGQRAGSGATAVCMSTHWKAWGKSEIGCRARTGRPRMDWSRNNACRHLTRRGANIREKQAVGSQKGRAHWRRNVTSTMSNWGSAEKLSLDCRLEQPLAHRASVAFVP